VSVEDNYDNLGYPPDGAARDARYTRYVTPRLLLRTQTSAMIPPLLRAMALDPPRDVLLVCPGLVYRRDAIDRWHTGEPHQLDLWRITQGRLTPTDLREMIDTVVTAALPGHRYRTLPASHPYTTHGLQIEVEDGECWVEIGECGLAASAVLDRAGLESAHVAGLAMGLGLDRLLMLRKGIDDIRLLRADDPRIAKQMCDLAPYVPVSRQPSIRRDLSVAVDHALRAEDLGDRIREVLPTYLHQLESVNVLSEAAYEELSPAAHVRLGLRAGQKNVLVRLVLRDPARTLTRAEANTVSDLVYRAIHQGGSLEAAPAQF
jgi:phenylalanyl-tRNA synthetase alpha chain